MDRTKTAEVKLPPGGIVPETLVRDLEKFAAWEPADSPRATAMREAAEVLRKLPVRQRDTDRIDNKDFAIRAYRIDTAEEAKEMRIVFYNLAGQKSVLGYLELKAPAAYDFANDVLQHYDQLEGIK